MLHLDCVLHKAPGTGIMATAQVAARATLANEKINLGTAKLPHN